MTKNPKQSKKAKRSSRRTKDAVKPVEETETATTSVSTVTSQATPAPATQPTAAQPKVKLTASYIRSIAAQRTAAGKFTKVIFNQIGGKECPRFAPMTWKERDAFMAKPENAVVRERYEARLASVKFKSKA